MNAIRIPVPTDQIATLCRRHHVRKLAIFGSALRDDFRPDSDVDVLIDLEPGCDLSFDAHFDLLDALRTCFGREVDLVEEKALRNPFRRFAILSSQKVVYPHE